MRTFVQLHRVAWTTACTLAFALAGCASGQVFGPRAVAPVAPVQAEPLPPLPRPPAPPPVHGAPSDVDEPAEALAAAGGDGRLLDAFPAADVALLDGALAADLAFTFRLPEHSPAAPPMLCVAGDALLGCAARPVGPSAQTEAVGAGVASASSGAGE